MSVTHVLELDSQIELLDRLSLLTSFSSNLIVISGDSGYGKSWLAHRYLELGASKKNQCLLRCRLNQDDEQHRTLILRQIFPDALFNQRDTLIDSLGRMVETDVCDVVIVIDDAQLLSDTLLSELWGLVLSAQTNPKWHINVLLFTQVGRLESVLSRVTYGQELKPIELDIEMLSESEARRFFESLVVRYVDDQAEKRVRDAFKKVPPVPGDIMALGEMKVEKRIIIRSNVGSPRSVAAVVLLLLFLVAGGYWWMYNQPSPEDKLQQLTGNLEQTVIPTLEEPNIELNPEPSEQAFVERSDSDVDVLGATDDSDALPPTVTNDIASVGSEDTSQRVVIESDVVDALLQGKPEQADTSDIHQLVEQSVVDASQDVEVPLSSAQSQAEQTEAIASTASAQPSQAVVKFSFAKEELNALSPRAYTLQFSAMTSMEEVQAFLDKYDLNGQVRIYPTMRGDSEWYIITYQDYPTIQAARDAIEALPERLKSLGPWAKSLNQVQREIERVK